MVNDSNTELKYLPLKSNDFHGKSCIFVYDYFAYKMIAVSQK